MVRSGLVPHNLRLIDQGEPELSSPDGDIEVQVDEGEPNFETDEKGNILKIEHPDGSVSVSIDGRPIESADSEAEKSKDWFRNLVEDIDQGQLYSIPIRKRKSPKTGSAIWLKILTKGSFIRLPKT